MSASPVFVSNVRNPAAVLQNADGTALKTFFTPGASGSRLKSLSITSDDTVDRVIQLWITISSVDYLIGEYTVADGSGSNGVDLPVNGLNGDALTWLQTDGVTRFLDLASGAVLKVKSKTTVTAGKTIYFVGEAGDF